MDNNSHLKSDHRPCGNASWKHAMLINGSSVDISQQRSHTLFLPTRCRRVPLVHGLLWLTLVDPALPTSSYDQKDLCVFCRTRSRWQQNTAGPIKRPSSSTNTFLHNITGSVASCYKFHRLSTSLRQFWDPLFISVTVKASNFKFAIQYGFL